MCPPPGPLPDPGIKPGSPALQADSFPSEPPGKPSLNVLACKTPLRYTFPILRLRPPDSRWVRATGHRERGLPRTCAPVSPPASSRAPRPPSRSGPAPRVGLGLTRAASATCHQPAASSSGPLPGLATVSSVT